MRRVLVVDLDTDREETIRIGPMQTYENEKIQPDPVADMAVLCEALVTMIRLCHNEGIRDESESMRKCMDHIKKGFVDESYKTKYNKSESKKG